LNHVENQDWLHFKPFILFYFKPANKVHLNNILHQLYHYIAKICWIDRDLKFLVL